MDFDKPETWITVEIHERPSGVDVGAYQKRINAICGLSPFGTPNILLSWAPDISNYSKVYCRWDKAGFGLKTWLRGTYVFQTIWDDEDNPIDIPPPRWVLKQWLHPSQYLSADEDVRWKKIPVGKQIIVKEHRPPRAANGIYVPLEKGVMRRHNGHCCLEAKENAHYCWGFYREPDESYLMLLKKAVAERERENLTNPNEPISERAMKVAALEAARDIAAKQIIGEQAVSEFVEDNADTLLAQITGDKDFLKRKSFSFKNGLYYGNN